MGDDEEAENTPPLNYNWHIFPFIAQIIPFDCGPEKLSFPLPTYLVGVIMPRTYAVYYYWRICSCRRDRKDVEGDTFVLIQLTR